MMGGIVVATGADARVPAGAVCRLVPRAAGRDAGRGGRRMNVLVIGGTRGIGPRGGHGRARGGPHADGDGAPRGRLQRATSPACGSCWATPATRPTSTARSPASTRSCGPSARGRRGAPVRRLLPRHAVPAGRDGPARRAPPRLRHRRRAPATAPGRRGFLYDRIVQPLLLGSRSYEDKDRQESADARERRRLDDRAARRADRWAGDGALPDASPTTRRDARPSASPAADVADFIVANLAAPDYVHATVRAVPAEAAQARGPTAVDSRARAGRMPPVRRVGSFSKPMPLATTPELVAELKAAAAWSSSSTRRIARTRATWSSPPTS